MDKTDRTRIELSPNPLIRHLGKQPGEFTRGDLVRFIKDADVRIVNLNYVAADTRIKTLSVPVLSERAAHSILDNGERVDGSNLFPYIDPGASDIYVVPRYSTAFINPFNDVPTLNVMCAYFDGGGERLDISPEYIIDKSTGRLEANHNLKLAMAGEIEYYVLSEAGRRGLFPGLPQKNYHESRPFVKWEDIRNDIVTAIAATGARLKYAHAEVGDIPSSADVAMEQHEIEFNPEPPHEAADHVTVSKWIIRNFGARYRVRISFAPKIEMDHAGSGFHVHICPSSDTKLSINGDAGKMNETGRAMIGGLLRFARSLTAFGNTVPTSYFRLRPNFEAPTSVCWGPRNRSALVRVPLGWVDTRDMAAVLNPRAPEEVHAPRAEQTFELRSPDASADPYLLMAGIVQAVEWGLSNKAESVRLADESYVSVNIHKPECAETAGKLRSLPASCWEAAEALAADRALYEAGAVFPPTIVDGVIEILKRYDDRDLMAEHGDNPAHLKGILEDYLHCG